jgi:hypothetical protein
VILVVFVVSEIEGSYEKFDGWCTSRTTIHNFRFLALFSSVFSQDLLSFIVLIAAANVEDIKVGRTPAYVKICNSQDTMSAT